MSTIIYRQDEDEISILEDIVDKTDLLCEEIANSGGKKLDFKVHKKKTFILNNSQNVIDEQAE